MRHAQAGIRSAPVRSELHRHAGPRYVPVEEDRHQATSLDPTDRLLDRAEAERPVLVTVL
jgi:hypothetical protein